MSYLVPGREPASLVQEARRHEDRCPIAPPDTGRFASTNVVGVEPLTFLVMQAAVISDISWIEDGRNVRHAELIPLLLSPPDLDL